MKPRRFLSTSVIRMGVFVLSLLLLAVNPAQVNASPRPDTSSENLWTITVSQFKNPICVGEYVYVTVTWRPNQRDPGQGLAPLAPMSGPKLIKVTSLIGRFIPESTYTPKGMTGTTRFAYVADREGNEKVAGVAMTADGSDATDSAQFTVKRCDYRYTLNGEARLYVEVEGAFYSTLYTIKSSGVLKATDASKPRNVEGKEKRIRLGAVMTSFSVPECTMFTWEPGTGGGSVDVRASPGPDDDSMVLEFGPPQELHWDLNYAFGCEGDVRSATGVYGSTSDEDPWISATFPSGGGQQNIRLDMFEIPMEKMNGQPGVSFSYTATVTLERVEPE